MSLWVSVRVIVCASACEYVSVFVCLCVRVRVTENIHKYSGCFKSS